MVIGIVFGRFEHNLDHWTRVYLRLCRIVAYTAYAYASLLKVSENAWQMLLVVGARLAHCCASPFSKPFEVPKSLKGVMKIVYKNKEARRYQTADLIL